MPLIDKDTHFNPDDFTSPVIGIAAELGAQHDSTYHKHNKVQLLFAPQGCMNITLDNQWLILPPTRAALIPASVYHRVQLKGKIAYRSLYFDSSWFANKPISILTVNPLLKELIERVCHWPFEQDCQQANHYYLLKVLQDEINQAQTENTQLMIPKDTRVKPFINNLATRDPLPTLTELANQLNLHSKTLTRIFKHQTGLSYQQWIQQYKLMRAIELLAEANSISHVAQRLAFSSDSAFIAFFKQYTGTTPKRYMLAN